MYVYLHTCTWWHACTYFHDHTSFYTFILFQASHYQPQTLDGDAIHATSDDWADFQLRTTWGWQQLGRPLLCVPWLNLNLQVCARAPALSPALRGASTAHTSSAPGLD